MLDEINCWYYDKRKLIDLTPNETKLLSILIDNKYRIVSIQEICTKVFNDYKNIKIYENSIKLLISRLNKKINFSIKIQSKYKKGYYLKWEE